MLLCKNEENVLIWPHRTNLSWERLWSIKNLLSQCHVFLLLSRTPGTNADELCLIQARPRLSLPGLKRAGCKHSITFNQFSQLEAFTETQGYPDLVLSVYNGLTISSGKKKFWSQYNWQTQAACSTSWLDSSPLTVSYQGESIISVTWPLTFFSSRSKNTQKKNLAISSHLDLTLGQ